MGSLSQPVVDPAVTNIKEVPELQNLWRLFRKHQSEIDYLIPENHVDCSSVIKLTGISEDGFETRHPRPRNYISSDGRFISEINRPRNHSDPGIYGPVNLGTIMRNCDCPTLKQFHNLLKKSLKGHFRLAETKASDRQKEMSDARVATAEIRFGDEVKTK